MAQILGVACVAATIISCSDDLKKAFETLKSDADKQKFIKEKLGYSYQNSGKTLVDFISDLSTEDDAGKVALIKEYSNLDVTMASIRGKSEDEILQTALKDRLPRYEFPSLYKQDNSIDLEEALAKFKEYKKDAALLPAAQAAQAKYDNFVDKLNTFASSSSFFKTEWTNLKTRIDNGDDPRAEVKAFHLKAEPYVQQTFFLITLKNILKCSITVPEAFTNPIITERMTCLSELSNRAYSRQAIYAEARASITQANAGHAIANALNATLSKTLGKGDFVVYRDTSVATNPAVLYEVTQDIIRSQLMRLPLGYLAVPI